jgi:hypothetical protein
MTTFTRGSAITFKATCLDAAGAPFPALRAMLTLSYVSTAGERVRVDVPMATVGTSRISTTWDSSQASDAMPVNWHIRASGSAGAKVAQDGTFTLSASGANPTHA